LPLTASCKKDDPTSNNTACAATPSETEGPFPTKIPSSLVLADFRSDRTGVTLTVKLTILNKNQGCTALPGAFVDIWHCDKDGSYSEYGGTGMQSANYTAVHFLRGRQTSDANGQVGFTTIFPGWYPGRATHIHVHIYDTSGNSLLVTQLAFPEGANSGVTLVNNSTANGYTKGMSGYTTNSKDNVFSDSYTYELASVLGSVSAGYELSHTINVSA
jgi:protocatechuate 3,4-dioxygenase beta subunit